MLSKYLLFVLHVQCHILHHSFYISAYTISAAKMSPPLPSCVEVPVLLSKLNQTVKDAKDLACLNGFLMRTKENPDSSDVVSPAPFMLLPSSIPKHLFQTALSIQPSINELYFKVANDYDFLWKTLEGYVS